MSKIKMKVLSITPSMAADMLAKNKKNRPVKKRIVNFLSKQMQQGMWKFTHQAIAFDNEDKLQDGQHRLLALIDYGKPLDFLVVYNSPKENFTVIDTGKSRSAADILALEGYHNYNNLSSSIKFIINYKENTISGAITSDRGTRNNSENVVTNGMILDYLKENPHLEDWTMDAIDNYYRKFPLIVPSLVSGMYCILKEQNPNLAEEFYNQLFLGTDIPKDSAIRFFRQRLINDQASNKNMSKKNKLAMLIKSWNSFKKKESVSGLRYDPKKEKFPELA